MKKPQTAWCIRDGKLEDLLVNDISSILRGDSDHLAVIMVVFNILSVHPACTCTSGQLVQ